MAAYSSQSSFSVLSGSCYSTAPAGSQITNAVGMQIAVPSSVTLTFVPGIIVPASTIAVTIANSIVNVQYQSSDYSILGISATSTPTETGVLSTSNGLSVGVVIPIAFLALLFGITFFWRRRQTTKTSRDKNIPELHNDGSNILEADSNQLFHADSKPITIPRKPAPLTYEMGTIQQVAKLPSHSQVENPPNILL